MINPLFKNWRHHLIYHMIWMMFAGFISVWWWLSFDCPLWLASVIVFPSTILFGFVNFSAYYVCRSQSMQTRQFNRSAFVFGLSSVLAGLIFWMLVRATLEFANALFLIRLPEQIYSTGFILGLIGFTLYLSSILLYDLFQAFDTVRISEQRESAAQLLAREAELHALRAQIDPHFLFNSLNSISALTTLDPQAARDMTLALSEFFRLSLTNKANASVSIRDELTLCEQFLRVEKFRYGEKLQTQFDIDSTLLDHPIPSMLLQPLFENAIKHGIRGLAKGGCIHLRIARADTFLELSMSNPIPMKKTLPTPAAQTPHRHELESPANSTHGAGIGLKNIRQRCHVLYGDAAHIQVQKDDQLFGITIRIPYQNHDDKT